MNIKSIALTLLLFLLSCSSGEKKENATKKTTAKAVSTNPLDNKGIGPVKTLHLPSTIDQNLVKKGIDIYKAKCTACHRADKNFIGPSPTGIMKRRSAEWIMNMILNPNEMILKDPIAKKLLRKFNGAPMANQNLTEDEARAVLEYFRTLN